MSKECQRRHLDTVEVGCQEGSEEEKGREEGEDDEGREERRVRNEVVKEVIAGIQKKATDEGVENKGKR